MSSAWASFLFNLASFVVFEGKLQLKMPIECSSSKFNFNCCKCKTLACIMNLIQSNIWSGGAIIILHPHQVTCGHSGEMFQLNLPLKDYSKANCGRNNNSPRGVHLCLCLSHYFNVGPCCLPTKITLFL